MPGLMRSFISSQATEMDRLLWFYFLLIYLPVTESMDKTVCLSQPKVVWRKTEQSAVLSCTVHSNCSDTGLQYRWFVFRKDTHSEVHDSPPKCVLNGPTLHINSLDVTDSGIYHCAAVSLDREPEAGRQHIGLGTTLVVREKTKVRHILLWLSFILMAIYSLVILALVILKKYGYHRTCIKMNKTSNVKTSSKRMQFRDVLQELYSRRNSERNKQSARRNRPQTDEAASPKFNGSIDDIYQNV
ncbi:uncharacterized protein LOC115425004 [Sphaeramia orbicularis]|uniref:uncharacterized protein LOC115425004 n=1 Tax=Sphaeramia orbicularis TaxID=375764 RepID=UPI00117D5AD7|nr:uncharacterized protein LOC115425004 [Sphaeramia orbicularis]